MGRLKSRKRRLETSDRRKTEAILFAQRRGIADFPRSSDDNYLTCLRNFRQVCSILSIPPRRNERQKFASRRILAILHDCAQKKRVSLALARCKVRPLRLFSLVTRRFASNRPSYARTNRISGENHATRCDRSSLSFRQLRLTQRNFPLLSILLSMLTTRLLELLIRVARRTGSSMVVVFESSEK